MNFEAGQVLDVEILKELDRGRIIKTERYTDTTTRNFGTSVGVGYTTPIFSRARTGSGSKIRMRYRIPGRNDSGSWGGGYIHIYYSTDATSGWQYLGSGGYDAAVMGGNGQIAADKGEIWLEDIPGSQIQFQLRHRSYDGTFIVNGSHDITTGSNGWGWTNIYVEEIST